MYVIMGSDRIYTGSVVANTTAEQGKGKFRVVGTEITQKMAASYKPRWPEDSRETFTDEKALTRAFPVWWGQCTP